ncbi:MAG: GNAT family N-acetyltransferase [Gaiellaceae bacterium]
MTGTAIEVGPLREPEVAPLFALAKSAFAGAPGWHDRHVLGVLRDDVVFVAREGGVAAGYVALRPNPDDSVLIEQLLVAPGHERRGVGRRLLAHAEGYAISQRAPTLLIVVEPDNRTAAGLYRRLGYAPLGSELFQLVLPRLA